MSGKGKKRSVSKESSISVSKKQKTADEPVNSTYESVKQLLLEEKARDFDQYTATIEKLKKFFEAESSVVGTEKCRKEFLTKFKMPKNPELQKIMEGFKVTKCEILQQWGHDSLVERNISFYDGKITLELQSSMSDYETSYSCFVYANKRIFRADEVKEIDEIFDDESEFGDFFDGCQELLGKVTSEQLKSLLISIVTILDQIWQ